MPVAVLIGSVSLPLAHAGATGVEIGSDPWLWTLDPVQILPILFVAFLYARRARTLAEQARPVGSGRQTCFYAGLVLVLVALVTPVDALGETRFLFVHMTQHILIGDLAALLIVTGLTGPLLRPVLTLPLLGRLRVLAHPLVALPLWALNLYLWHLPAAYQTALANDAVHAFQHVCFFATGAFMWAAIVEPLPGPAWFGSGFKALYVAAVRALEAVLANIFIWSGSAFYPHYVQAERLWGISATADQNIGGAIMLLEGSIVTLAVFAWLFLRWLSDSERRQELIEQGIDAAKAGRAVRYSRPDRLGEATRQRGSA